MSDDPNSADGSGASNHPDDIEARLTAALETTAGQTRPGRRPAFSWEQPGAGATPAGSGAPAMQKSRRSRRDWLTTAAVAGVAGAAAAAVVVLAVGPGGSSDNPAAPASHSPVAIAGNEPTGNRSASTLLLTAAHTTLAHGQPALADGQYRYVRTTSRQYTDEMWIPKNPRDVWERKQHSDNPGLGPDDTVWKGKCGDLYVNAIDGPKGDACDRPGSFGDATPAFVAALPHDPDVLYARLHEFAQTRLNPEKDDNVDSVVFTTVNDLLLGGMLRTTQVSGMYDVLSRVPGIEVVDHVTNTAGSGTGFRLTRSFGSGPRSDVETTTVVIDVRSGTYLGYTTADDDGTNSFAVTHGVADQLGQPGH